MMDVEKNQKIVKRQKSEKMKTMTKKRELVAGVPIRVPREVIGREVKKTTKKFLLKIAVAGRDAEFINGYETLNESDRLDRDLMMAYGDALYELERDAECIRVYLDFALVHPNERGKDFALYGAAMAFKNIGLYAEALFLLILVKPDHGERNEEISHSERKIEVQRQAVDSLSNFKSKLLAMQTTI
jgi:hypothetical protein